MIDPRLIANALDHEKVGVGLIGQDSPYDGDLGSMEGLLHELAHAVVLDLKEEHYDTHDIADEIARLDDLAADWSELKTLAAEIVAAQMLGHELNVELLAGFACDQMKTLFTQRPRTTAAVRCLLPAKTTARNAARIVDYVSRVVAARAAKHQQ